MKNEHTKFSGNIPAAYDRYLGPLLFQPYAEADACDLPFDDGQFNAVVCQFGIMFVSNKALAAREAYRVLKRDGLFLFNVWDAMRHNKLGELAHRTITSYFENDPPMFYKVPFSYHDRGEIRRILKQAGFREIKTEIIAKIGKATRAEDVARGLVEGNPVAVTIATRDPSLLPIIKGAVTAAITRRFGERDIRAPMRAIVVRARA